MLRRATALGAAGCCQVPAHCVDLGGLLQQLLEVLPRARTLLGALQVLRVAGAPGPLHGVVLLRPVRAGPGEVS
jgi:hypothetical protein